MFACMTPIYKSKNSLQFLSVIKMWKGATYFPYPVKWCKNDKLKCQHTIFVIPPWQICKLPMVREGFRAAISSKKWHSEPPEAQNDLQLREIKKYSNCGDQNVGHGDRMAVAWRRRESHGDRFVGLGGHNLVLRIRRGSGGQFAGLIAALHPLPAWGVYLWPPNRFHVYWFILIWSLKFKRNVCIRFEYRNWINYCIWMEIIGTFLKSSNKEIDENLL